MLFFFVSSFLFHSSWLLGFLITFFFKAMPSQLSARQLPIFLPNALQQKDKYFGLSKVYLREWHASPLKVRERSAKHAQKKISSIFAALPPGVKYDASRGPKAPRSVVAMAPHQQEALALALLQVSLGFICC